MSDLLHTRVSFSKLLQYRTIYRALLLLRFLLYISLFKYRFLTYSQHASAYWFTVVASEMNLALLWLISTSAKLFPVERETYPERLANRCKANDTFGLPAVDIFITTADPFKEPPLITVNTILSALAVDYPVDKVNCYVSDDGGSPFTFWAMVETSRFAKHWVPFCKRFSIEPRAPVSYFNQDLQDHQTPLSEDPHFTQEFHNVKEAYDRLRERIITLMEDSKVPEKLPNFQFIDFSSSWTAQDHPGLIQVLLNRDTDRDADGGLLPNFTYISREKRTNHRHHYKAGAMNALTRVSAIMTNAPFILNVDCDMYINNSKALLHSMCIFMDSSVAGQIGFVQFPQRFEAIDENDLYGNKMKALIDITLKCMDGIQGPLYCGTGCVHRRNSLYGSEPVGATEETDTENDLIGIKSIPYEGIQKRFGQSFALALTVKSSFAGSERTFTKLQSVTEEALRLLESTYEDNTKWGKEIGWIYGSATEDVLTGFTVHCRGWNSVCCMPPRPAFIGCAPTNCQDTLICRKRWHVGLLEFLIGRHSPLYYGGTRMMFMQRLTYIWLGSFPLAALPLFLYAIIPALCLLSEKSVFPKVSDLAMLRFILVFLSIYGTSYFESLLVDIGVKEWWNTNRMDMITAVTSSLFAELEVLLKVVGISETGFDVTPKEQAAVERSSSSVKCQNTFEFSTSPLFIPPTVLLITNLVGIAAASGRCLLRGGGGGGGGWLDLLLSGELVSACWAIACLYPLLQGMYRKGKAGIPTATIVKSITIACLIVVAAAART